MSGSKDAMAGWYRKGSVPKREEGREQRKERRGPGMVRQRVEWIGSGLPGRVVIVMLLRVVE